MTDTEKIYNVTPNYDTFNSHFNKRTGGEKTPYDSFEEAMAAIAKNPKLTGCSPYRCPVCGKIHVGHPSRPDEVLALQEGCEEEFKKLREEISKLSSELSRKNNQENSEFIVMKSRYNYLVDSLKQLGGFEFGTEKKAHDTIKKLLKAKQTLGEDVLRLTLENEALIAWAKAHGLSDAELVSFKNPKSRADLLLEKIPEKIKVGEITLVRKILKGKKRIQYIDSRGIALISTPSGKFNNLLECYEYTYNALKDLGYTE